MNVSSMRAGFAIREPRSSPLLALLALNETLAADGFAALPERGVPDNRRRFRNSPDVA